MGQVAVGARSVNAGRGDFLTHHSPRPGDILFYRHGNDDVKITSSVNKDTLGRWTDVDGDHGMREAHSVWVRQHHALLIAGLVASSLKQRSHTDINNNSINREIKFPRV